MIRRTLLFAGVFALVAMLFVPMPESRYAGGGYRFIFDKSHTGVAFFQLLVNVVFAAGLGATIAQVRLSKRALKIIGWVSVTLVLVALIVSIIAYNADSNRKSAHTEEEYARAWFVPPYGAEEAAKASEHYRAAAVYWWRALRFDKADEDEARANQVAEEMKALAEAPEVRKAKPVHDIFDDLVAPTPGVTKKNREITDQEVGLGPLPTPTVH